MYSPVVVAGSNTHNMSPKKNNSSKTSRSADGLHCTVREEVVVGSAPGPGTLVVSLTTTSTGSTAAASAILCPQGLSAATYVSGGFVTGTTLGNVDPPHLRKLYNICSDFTYYRVLSGKFIFVRNVGSTTVGNIVMMSSRDVYDSCVVPQVAYSSGPNYKTFPLSSTKEISIPLDVDTSWKKVSSILTVPTGVQGFSGVTTATGLVPINTANDLAFSSIAAQVVNGTSSTNFGIFVVEYVLECKGPIDSAINA